MDVQQRRQRRGGQPSEQPKRFARRPGSQKNLKGGGRGGKRVKLSAEHEAGLPGRKRRRQVDEEIESDSISDNKSVPSADSESDEGEENTDEERLRVARQYLRQFAEAAEGRSHGDGATAALRKGNELEADLAFESTGENSADTEGEAGEDASGDDLFFNADAKAAVAEQLKRKAGEKLLSRTLSSVASGLRFKPSSFFRGHKLPVTCMALPGGGGTQGFGGSAGSSQQHAYTGGKDCCVIRWDLETGSKEVFKGQRNCFGGWGKPAGGADTGRLSGHFRPVLDLCVAPDERLFFSAGAEHTIRGWDPRASNSKCMFELRGHRGPVTGVRFNGEEGGANEGEAELVSCSADKSLKTWSLSCRSVANHFYGHATEVNCIDLLQPDKPITGGSDGTLRNWKLAQDTHAAFPPLGSCVDSVAIMSPSLFCCGTQGGLLSLFNSSCKKPLACVRVDAFSGAEKVATAQPRAPLRATGAATSVSALGALRLTDALLVGTEGGAVQLWAATQHDRKAGGGSLTAIPGAAAQAGGVVTGLCVSKDNSFAVAAVSTESRLGRWHKSEGAKNGIRVIPFAST
ncbi:hypothetical protein Esti_001833 [Eimeria stiedai]